MLKVLWYYIRLKTNKMLTGRGGTGEKTTKTPLSVIREKWRRYHMCDKAKIIPQNLHAIFKIGKRTVYLVWMA